MARYRELRPHLLNLLLNEDDEDWEDNDPRWYLAIHAGRLLIAHREEAAIPLFIEILRYDEHETLAEWFQTDLHNYGPRLLSPLLDLLHDESVIMMNRISAIEILTDLAGRFPELRAKVRNEFRALLPPLQADGTVDVDDPDEDEIELWTFAAGGLGDLGDKQSLPHVEALHKQDLIDEILYGDFEEYQKEYFSPKGFRRQRRKEPFDIYQAYSM